MNSFEIKRGHGKSLENGGLKSLMEEEFGEVNEDGNLFTASFKALTKISVEFVSITEVRIETETDAEASPEDSLEILELGSDPKIKKVQRESKGALDPKGTLENSREK